MATMGSGHMSFSWWLWAEQPASAGFSSSELPHQVYSVTGARAREIILPGSNLR